MDRPLFLRLVEAAKGHDVFFQRRCEGIERFSFSSLQKCTNAMRMLAYGTAADAVNEYLRLSTTSARTSLEKFCDVIISRFGDQYLRRPNPLDLERLLRIGERRGFSGSCNDINVIHQSPVFDDILEGRAPSVSFEVNDHKYDKGYYLIDEIYPKWATFTQSVTLPLTRKDRLFATKQESARKDVERAFRVLQARFAILRKPLLACSEIILGKITKACIIMHNMIVEDERDMYANYDDASEFWVDKPKKHRRAANERRRRDLV